MYTICSKSHFCHCCLPFSGRASHDTSPATRDSVGHAPHASCTSRCMCGIVWLHFLSSNNIIAMTLSRNTETKAYCTLHAKVLLTLPIMEHYSSVAGPAEDFSGPQFWKLDINHVNNSFGLIIVSKKSSAKPPANDRKASTWQHTLLRPLETPKQQTATIPRPPGKFDPVIYIL